MKCTFLLILGFLLPGCKKDCCEYIPDRPEFKLVNADGQDLLSPATPNSLEASDIEFWTVKDGTKILLSTSIRERIRFTSDTSFLVTFIREDGKTAYMSNNSGAWEVFIQFRSEDIDTITWVTSGNGGTIFTDEVRYNGKIVEMKLSSLKDFYTIEKHFD
ncbi:hypothetical protein [Marinoscillum sp.]|uniref:hypothetical protein n=1 Tax=Marinoscillum sp. TaxID=2024838 RepID=UPI003BAA6387